MERGQKQPQFIRRPLRDATLWDRILIALFFFIAGAMVTGGIYWYLSQPDMSSSHRRASLSSTIITPLEDLTGPEATRHFVLVCFAGGLLAAIAYVYMSLADPYGTTAAAKAEKKRKRDRFEFLKQAGYPVADPDDPEDGATQDPTKD